MVVVATVAEIFLIDYLREAVEQQRKISTDFKVVAVTEKVCAGLINLLVAVEVFLTVTVVALKYLK